jgi:hypothetical protein
LLKVNYTLFILFNAFLVVVDVLLLNYIGYAKPSVFYFCIV